jgi:hypothetical protein
LDNLLKYFGGAFLINLPERKDRLRTATKELARIGWSVGSNGVEIYVARKFSDRARFPSSPGVRGCFHSHWECIRRAYAQGKNSVLLIEDDIGLSPSIPGLTPGIISQLESKTWDFFYLGHEYTGDIECANARTSEVKLLPVKTEIRTTQFYAVHGRIFSRLLEHLDRVASGTEGDQEFGPMPIDGAFNIFRRINPDVRGFMAVPKLGWQRPSRSDITPKPFDQFVYLRPFIRALRNIKYATSRWRS